MKQLKFVLLTVTVILIFSSCEKEIKTNPILQSSDSEISARSAHKVWERLTWTELQSDLQFLEIVDELEIEVLYQGSQIDQIFIDSSTISKCSDITNNYSSFTFPVHSEPSSSNVIKNVVLEKKGVSYKSNIIEYTIGFDDLYALMTNTFTDFINIPVDIYPVDPNTIQLRGCVWITIEFTIPCPCQGHINPDFCSCGTQPIVSYHTYLACDDSTGGDDEGINIYPTGDTTPGTGGGGGDPVGDDNGDNTGTELLIPTAEWYLIKLNQFNDDYDLDLTIEELQEIIPIDCMGGGNPLVGEFEECAVEAIGVSSGIQFSETEIDLIMNFEPKLISDIAKFLDNYPNDPLAIQIVHDFIDLQHCGESNNPCVHKDYDNRFNEYYNFLLNNPEYDFDYVVSNKTDMDSDYVETWDSEDGPFADHPIDDFDPDQTPWPTYGPVIDKTKAVLYEHDIYDCHAFAKLQLGKAGYKISNYFLEYIGEGSPNNVLHYETIQVYEEFEGVNLAEIDNALDYLYSALKRNIPVLVGVSTKAGSANPLTDNTTEHFVVIVGMGTDENGNYFSFYDSGDTEIDKVTHIDNKLYFADNKFTGKSKVDYANGFTYTLAQIRKSKPE